MARDPSILLVYAPWASLLLRHPMPGPRECGWRSHFLPFAEAEACVLPWRPPTQLHPYQIAEAGQAGGKWARCCGSGSRLSPPALWSFSTSSAMYQKRACIHGAYTSFSHRIGGRWGVRYRSLTAHHALASDPSELAELASSRRDGETSLLKFLSSSNTAPMRRSMRDGPPADMVRQVYTFARKVARHLAVDGRTAAHALSILGAITPPRLLANALLQNDEVDAESHMAVTGALAPALEALMPFAADACTAAAGSFKARPVAVMAGAFTFVRRRCAEHFAPAADQAMIALLSHGLPASAFATMREVCLRLAGKALLSPAART